jgi:hypothetical protein
MEGKMANPLNEPRKVIPLPSHIEGRFTQAWEDAYSPNWHHPADGMREFIRELLAEKSKNEADMLKALEAVVRAFKRPTPAMQNRGVHDIWRELVDICARARGDEPCYEDKRAAKALAGV